MFIVALRLIQYRIAAAAVSDSFIPWVQAHAMDAISGPSPIVVVDHAQQINSLKTQILSHGITVMGLEWQTAAGLRRLLCQRLDVPFEPLGRENLELLIRIAAAKMKSPLAVTLAADPEDALRAMDELGRSGRMPQDWENVFPPDFLKLGQMLEQTGEWLPAREFHCLLEAQENTIHFGPVCLFGWGGMHYPDARLVSILRHVADDLTIIVPQPRLMGGEDLDEEWILELERQLGVESEFAQDPVNWTSLHEGFSSSLMLEEPVTDAVLPKLLVGKTVEDQAVLVADWVVQQSSSDQNMHPVGCLVPGEGGSLHRLTDEFSRREIVFHQEIGEVHAAGGFHTFHKFLVRCFATHADTEEVLKLLEWLLARNEPCMKGLEYRILREKCIRRFNRIQSRDFSELWAEGSCEEPLDLHEAALIKFSKWLRPWPDQVSWENARKCWLQAATDFGFGTDYLEPVWSRLSQHLSGQMLASRYFFDYVESLLGAPGLWRDETALNPYARVIITNQAAAVGRSWGALVFMDSQEGVWPEIPKENPFLRDSKRAELNRNRQAGISRLLTVEDRSRMQQQTVLGLVENCSGSVLFSGSLTDGKAPEVKTFPNEWAAQVLLSDREASAEALQGWEAAGQNVTEEAACSCKEQSLALDLQQLKQVHKQRSDPDAAMDAYDFCFSVGAKKFNRPLGASGLDKILEAPASFAMRAIFNASPREHTDFMRKESLLLGEWTHAALAPIFNRRVHASIDQIIQDYRPVATVVPGLWMQVLAEKASWMVRSCLLEVQQLGSHWMVERVEWRPENITVPTPSGSLLLSGRLDLMLKSDRGDELIIDFKTGKTGELPTPKTLKSKATGLQYIAYLLLTENGCRDRSVRVINPFESQERELTPEHIEAAQEHLCVLAHMTRTKIFPRRGPLRNEYGFSAETLPLTTIPVDASVLESKWQVLLAGVITS